MKKIILIFLIYLLFIGTVSAETVILDEFECIDGDTIKATIDGEKKTVRFLAINTPETKYSTKDKDEPYAVEASEWTCKRLNEGSKILLEYDEASDKTDKYGRVLGWIFIDDSLLQKELVSMGYAKVDYIYGEYKYVDEIKKVEEKAKEEKLGIWDKEKSDEIIEEEEYSAIDKIIDYIWEKIKELFKVLIKKIKEVFKELLKSY
jgi:micrococcal nuclease